MTTRTRAAETAFMRTVKTYFAEHRRSFPWRTTTDPYHILVSEIMLQQTQTDRVVPKYTAFLKKFPTAKVLADAPFKEVLTEWKGLGYNRRAKFLQAAVTAVTRSPAGTFPSTFTELTALPGIGPYTAGALMAFAFNLPHPVIETNIRTVYIHHFFPRAKKVPDAQLLPLIERTLDTTHPREWYAALMDYGAMLKKTHTNPSRRSTHHVKQTAFKGSDRYIRGKILTLLLTKPHTTATLVSLLSTDGAERTGQKIDRKRITGILAALKKEHIITHTRQLWQIAD